VFIQKAQIRVLTVSGLHSIFSFLAGYLFPLTHTEAFLLFIACDIE
jgi:hypothetical protein